VGEKQRLMQELCKLYRLRDEGKSVDILIEELEAKLFGLCDECDQEEKDAEV
jgi:hypothetical protein